MEDDGECCESVCEVREINGMEERGKTGTPALVKTAGQNA